MSDVAHNPVTIRQLLLLVASALVGFALLVGALTIIWFVKPTSNVPDHADAAVVYAGGRGERLQIARGLAEDGIVDALVINAGTDFDSRAGVWVEEFCESPPEDLDVRCIVASPDSTQGEGASFARYAEEQGWTSLIAVSTDHHLKRAELSLARCFDGDVYRASGSAPTSFRQVRHEWAAVIASYTFDRDCPPPETE